MRFCMRSSEYVLVLDAPHAAALANKVPERMTNAFLERFRSKSAHSQHCCSTLDVDVALFIPEML